MLLGMVLMKILQRCRLHWGQVEEEPVARRVRVSRLTGQASSGTRSSTRLQAERGQGTHQRGETNSERAMGSTVLHRCRRRVPVLMREGELEVRREIILYKLSRKKNLPTKLTYQGTDYRSP